MVGPRSAALQRADVSAALLREGKRRPTSEWPFRFSHLSSLLMVRLFYSSFNKLNLGPDLLGHKINQEILNC